MSIHYQTKREEELRVWHRFHLPKTQKHLHKSAEMIYLKTGCAACSVDGVDYTLAAGDALIVFPEQLHEYSLPTADFENYALRFPADCPMLSAVFEGNVPASAKIEAGRVPNMEALFTALLDAAHDKENPFSAFAAHGALCTLLSAVLGTLTLTPVNAARRDTGTQMLRYIADHSAEPLTLPAVAAQFGYSPNYLSHLFAVRFHVGFTEFINNLRVENAKELLRGTLPITEIGFVCGFSGIRNFNRVFRAAVGKSPSEYRADARRLL